MTRNERVSSPEYWDEMLNNQLYQLVMEQKKKQKLTVKAIAEKAGLHPITVRNYLNTNHHSMTLYNICKILLAMGVVPEFDFSPLAIHLTADSDEFDLT